MILSYISLRIGLVRFVVFGVKYYVINEVVVFVCSGVTAIIREKNEKKKMN